MRIQLKIGQLAKLTKTTAPTIRYYEEIGLLPSPRRQSGSQRIYEQSNVRQLTFIRRCRELGFPIERIRALMSLLSDENRPCSEARDIARLHLTEIRKKLREIKELESTVSALVADCERRCADSMGADCLVLNSLLTSASKSVAHAEQRTGCCSNTAASLLSNASDIR